MGEAKDFLIIKSGSPADLVVGGVVRLLKRTHSLDELDSMNGTPLVHAQECIVAHLMDNLYGVVVAPNACGFIAAIKAQHVGPVVGYGFSELDWGWDAQVNLLAEIDPIKARAYFISTIEEQLQRTG